MPAARTTSRWCCSGIPSSRAARVPAPATRRWRRTAQPVHGSGRVPAPATQAFMTTTVGRYEIIDKLGEGAMGVVYRARDKTLGRMLALKMLSADLTGEEELQRRFNREAVAIGRLSHPNIVTVYDQGESEGHLYLAMELLVGRDLRAMIEDAADVSLADRIRIMIQIGQGLGY